MDLEQLNDAKLCKATRDKHGYTQSKLGHILGFEGEFANRRISEVERGERELKSIRRIILISKYMEGKREN